MKLQELESNIEIIIRAFSDNIEGARFLLKYIAIPDTSNSHDAVEFLYKKIIALLGRNQRALAMKITGTLKSIRKIILSDIDGKEFLEKKIAELDAQNKF